jgi:hypothetical protein
MADDHAFRSHRSNDPYRQAEPTPTADPTAARDPLAELARLIGRSDPFADFGRSSRPAQREASFRDDYAAAPQRDAEHEPYYAAEDTRSFARDDYYGRQEPPLASPPTYADDRRFDSHYDEQHYYEERQRETDDYGRQYADDGHHLGDYGQHASDRANVAPAYQDLPEGTYIEDETPLDPSEDAMYDDAPRRAHRRGLAMSLALIGCAMLGTAAAYGYRSYYPVSPQPPSVISPDTSAPIKIVPAGDAQSGRAVQGTLANAGREQVVTTQEEPISLQDLGAPSAPRVVLPAPVAPAAAAPTPPAAARPAVGPLAGTEAKPVRTVTIRPDGGDSSGRPVSAAPPPAPRGPAPMPVTGPLALQPQAAESATPRVRTVTVAHPPPEITSATPAGYVVQLSSQKTEAEAQSVFRSLQAKFPNELGDRQPLIKRADLGGGKGVVYRTQVGPFPSAQEASRFCASYKAAGGQCFVP